LIRTKLRQYQLNNLKFHLTKNKSLDFSEMGLGKTLISLSKIDILQRKQLITATLIICSKSVIQVWKSEIEKHSDFTYIILEGSLENKIRLLTINSNIYLISYDAIAGRKRTLGVLLHFLLLKKFDMVVLDEITYVQHYNTLRTKAITSLCDHIKYSISLSGTPITNAPEAVLTLFRVADSGQTFGRNYFAARGHFFNNHGYGFPDWRLKEDRIEEFQQRLFFNAVRLLKSECLDLPKKIYTERYSELTGIQKEIYVKVADELLRELILPSGKVKIQNSLVKLAKLSQITSGFIYTDREVQLFPENPKLELLKEVLTEIQSNEKIIIFVKWRQDIINISNMLDNIGVKYVILQGATTDRASVIDRFNSESGIQILLSQITVGAFGLNLTVSSHILFYSLGFSLIEYLQSQDRIHRLGQTQPCIYINLLCNKTIDEYVYNTLQQKVDVAKSLLDKSYIEKLKESLNGIRNINK